MKILHIVPNPFFVERGCLVRVQSQIRMAVSKGNECHVLCYHHGKAVNGATIHRIISVPWYKNYAPGANFHRFYLDFLLMILTFRKGWKLKPDIIHAHLHEGLAVSLPLARVLKIPLLFDAEGSLTGEMKAHRFPLSSCFLSVEKILTRSSDSIVTSSEQFKNVLISTFNYPSARCRVLNDSIDTDFFKPQPADTDLLKKYSIDSRVPVSVYLGTLNNLQGIDLLLNVSLIIKNLLPELLILIMGFPDETHWETQFRLRGSDNVIFTGKIDREDVPAYLSIGKIALAPKRADSLEGNGKILDYMAMGLPVVAFDTLTNRNLLGEDYDCVTPYDCSEFANRMVALIKDAKESRKLSTLLRRRACSFFSESIRKVQLIQVYNDLLSTTTKSAL